MLLVTFMACAVRPVECRCDDNPPLEDAIDDAAVIFVGRVEVDELSGIEIDPMREFVGKPKRRMTSGGCEPVFQTGDVLVAMLGDRRYFSKCSRYAVRDGRDYTVLEESVDEYGITWFDLVDYTFDDVVDRIPAGLTSGAMVDVAP